MSEEKSNTPPLSSCVAALIAMLSPQDLSILLNWLRTGKGLTPALAAVLSKIQDEMWFDELLLFLNEKNKSLMDELARRIEEEEESKEKEDDLLLLTIQSEQSSEGFADPRVPRLLAELPPDKRAMLFSALSSPQTGAAQWLIGYLSEELNWAPLVDHPKN